MKMITAIIQPDMLDAVREALIADGITRITVSKCAGHGQKIVTDLYRGVEVAPTLNAKTRIDIACNKDFVDVAIKAILSAAKHGEGEVGDGKIFVTPLDECIRIRTEEKGKKAI
jgi:nitrogen regulatory protein P-II 1